MAIVNFFQRQLNSKHHKEVGKKGSSHIGPLSHLSLWHNKSRVTQIVSRVTVGTFNHSYSYCNFNFAWCKE